MDVLKHHPTDDQLHFIQRVAHFLSEPEKKDVFVLRGYAGTGKTTMISALVNALKRTNYSTVLMAPTGRAAKVVSNYSGKMAFTIHKRIYWAEERDGSVQFVLGKNKAKNTLFIVDEASMIAGGGTFNDQNVLDDLIRYVYQGTNCRILFVGDMAQLPPVHKDLSPALEPRALRDDYNLRVDGAELKAVVRQTDESGILKNATVLRNRLSDGQWAVQFDAQFNDVHTINGNDLPEVLESCYGKYGLEETILLTRSNKRANLFNEQIRTRLLFHEEKVNSGDLLMVVKNNYHWLDKTSKMGFIANGDMLKVNRMIDRESRFGMEFATVSATFVDYPDEPSVDVKLNLSAINSEKSALSQEEFNGLYYAVKGSYHHLNSKQATRDAIKKDPYLNALQVKFAYAVTCHKAQGGQWKAVIVDQGYLTQELLDKNLMRWMYTAITRATEQLYLLNFHSQFIVAS